MKWFAVWFSGKTGEQQQYVYDNRVYSVPDRIVSISQPYIRPIVRGKAKASVEFRAKLDTTTRNSIVLSIIAMNVNRLTVVSFSQIFKRTRR